LLNGIQNESSQRKVDIKSADTQQGFIINLIREHDPFVRPKIYIQIKSSSKQRNLDEYFRMKNIIQDFLSFALARPIRTLSITGCISTSDTNVTEGYTRKVSVEVYHTEFTDPF
jgi:hypothetical protein